MTAVARLLFVQPTIMPPGGGNVLAAWMLQGLHSTVHDFGLADAAEFLLEDVAPLPEARAHMRRLQAEAQRKPSAAAA